MSGVVGEKRLQTEVEAADFTRAVPLDSDSLYHPVHFSVLNEFVLTFAYLDFAIAFTVTI
ncbi:MAG: hypothetical protein GYB64_07820 [Chloroflexi bacterium]|nr:hypothetical protein [Chloroflexota bacterium]